MAERRGARGKPRRSKRKGALRRWAGRLLAAAGLWFVGMGLAWGLLDLRVTPLMALRFAQGYGWQQQWRDLGALGEAMPAAVIGSEDQRFCQHGGVDWIELERVARGERGGGGSTVTMQVAKNLLLWPSRGGGSPLDFARKGLEIPLALALDAAWGKARVMEIYLNVAEFGPGIYGAEAASRVYFQKPAAGLSAAEAGALVAALPAPLSRQPAIEAGATRRTASALAGWDDCLQ